MRMQKSRSLFCLGNATGVTYRPPVRVPSVGFFLRPGLGWHMCLWDPRAGVQKNWSNASSLTSHCFSFLHDERFLCGRQLEPSAAAPVRYRVRWTRLRGVALALRGKKNGRPAPSHCKSYRIGEIHSCSANMRTCRHGGHGGSLRSIGHDATRHEFFGRAV